MINFNGHERKLFCHDPYGSSVIVVIFWTFIAAVTSCCCLSLVSADAATHQQPRYYFASHRATPSDRPRSSTLTYDPLLFRGGSQRPSDPSAYFPPNAAASNGYAFGNAAQPPMAPPPSVPSSDDAEDPFHETVQERVDAWRSHQREQSAAVLNSPRDEQGRMKLLTSVSKGSRALIFFFLMWRDIHLYEVADQLKTGITRLLFAIPLTLLFIANLAGAVASLTSPSHSAKKRLKAILNLDKLVEVLLIAYYFMRLTILPSQYTPREIYVANTLHSVFFILQCQGFTRLSWDETSAQPVHSYPAAAAASGLPPEEQLTPEDDWYIGREPQPFDPRRF
jgi:hypothetical protein